MKASCCQVCLCGSRLWGAVEVNLVRLHGHGITFRLHDLVCSRTPSQVDAEKAVAEGWWYKPPYIINELNINSAIVYPRHGEVVRYSVNAKLSLAKPIDLSLGA